MSPAWTQKNPELDAVELDQKEGETFIADLAEILYKMGCQFDALKVPVPSSAQSLSRPTPLHQLEEI